MIPKNKLEKKRRKHAPAETSVAHEVSHTEKTLEAVGEDKEVVKLTDDQSKSAEKSVGLLRFLPRKPLRPHFKRFSRPLYCLC